MNGVIGQKDAITTEPNTGFDQTLNNTLKKEQKMFSGFATAKEFPKLQSFAVD